MDTLKIGRYIQRLRKSSGMTQKDLAERLNISFQAVSKWENGDTLIYAIFWTQRQINYSMAVLLRHMSAG